MMFRLLTWVSKSMGKIKGFFKKEIDLRIAKIITTVVSPVISSLVGFGVIYKEYVYNYHGLSLSWVGCAIVIVLASIGTLVYFLKSGKVSNWDISDRRQRPKVLALILFYDVVLVALTWLLGYYEALPILILFSLSIGLASFITLFWKVSFHTFSVTLVTLFVLFTYNRLVLYPLLLLPFIVAWTRITLKKHLPMQAIGGIVLALLTTAAWTLFPVLKRVFESLISR